MTEEEPKFQILDDDGYTSTIYLLPGSPPRVVKAFKEECVPTHFPAEKEAYMRFSAANKPSSILKYHGVHEAFPAGIILELAEKGNLHKYRWDRRQFGKPEPEPELLYRWAGQAADGLAFAHGYGVLNSDVHCVNFFVDGELNLKVGDWAGASIDGRRSHSTYRLKYRLIDGDGTDVVKGGISIRTETFALGVAINYMVTGEEPWPELVDPRDKEEIQRRVAGSMFPDTAELVLGEVIKKCWNSEFTSMNEVVAAIGAERCARFYQSRLTDDAKDAI